MENKPNDPLPPEKKPLATLLKKKSEPPIPPPVVPGAVPPIPPLADKPASMEKKLTLGKSSEPKESAEFMRLTEALREPTLPKEETEKAGDVKIPLKIMVSKGFDEHRVEGTVEKLFCGCYPFVTRLVLCAATGSLLFGLNVSILNTSINTISAEFGWCEVRADMDCNAAILMKAFTTTAVFVGAAIGAMTGGKFLGIGRRMIILVDMVVFVIGSITCVVSTSFAPLVWGRLITGYGVGIISVVVPMYISEMTPASQRGAYGVFHQLFIVIGIFIGVLLGMPLQPIPADTDDDFLTFEVRTFDRVWWRVMLGIALVPSALVLLCLGYIFAFETPHFYVEHGKPKNAERLLKKLYRKDNVDDELAQIVKAREDAVKAKEQGLSFMMAMRIGVYRHVIFVGVVLAAFQQFVGINVFIASSNRLFSDAGLNRDLVTTMSTVLTLVNLLMTFPAIYLIEKLGRRTLMVLGNLGMALAVLPGAICFWIDSDATYTTWLSIAGAIVFIVCFATSFGPVLWVYLFEIFPIEIKGLGSGLGTAVNWVAGIAMVFITQFIPIRVNYTIFCAMSFIAVGLSFALMRETRGRTLEQSPFVVDKDGNPIEIQRPT